MWRGILRIHRYLGVAVGVLIAAWCLSGIVMMYVPYPAFDRSDELRALERLTLDQCCIVTAGPGSTDPITSAGVIDHFEVEMSGGRPVLRLATATEGVRQVDLTTGQGMDHVSVDQAKQIAAAFRQRLGIDGTSDFRGAVERDQWTVQSTYRAHRPLYKFAATDDASTEWYVSSRTGQVVQVTTGSQRFWNGLGAIPHWFYPTTLRQHTAAWSQTLIWATVLALFLTVTGMLVGVKRVRLRTDVATSPYRGWALWHHYAGLVFGLLTLTWLFSGLLSMNPWGALEGRSYAAERDRLRGTGLGGQQLRDHISSLSGRSVPGHTVRLEGSLFLGQPVLLAWSADGVATRLNPTSLLPEELTEAAFHEAVLRLRPGAQIAAEGWQLTEDAYYYSPHDTRDFPVYRVRYADGERIYLDAVSGALLQGTDAARRQSRWLFNALHSWDFLALARSRPAWDAVMLLLLCGVTLSAASGVVLAKRRLLRRR